MKAVAAVGVGKTSQDVCVMWLDKPGSVDVLEQLAEHQKMNRFPGLAALTRKAALSAYLHRARLAAPAVYDFYPRSWALPDEAAACIEYMETYGETMICKPSRGSCGRGIKLVTSPRDLPLKTEDMVAQEYIDNPLLLGGLKWDLRVYVLVTGVDPLSVFLYREGLARFATLAYEAPSAANVRDSFMHLTNYSVNRHSAQFVHEDGAFSSDDDDDGGRAGARPEKGSRDTKRLMTAVFDELEDLGHDVDLLWWQIKAIVGKTLHALEIPLTTLYRAAVPPSSDPSHCFHVLGFDIMVDDELNPWLLEVNHSPSLACTMDVDWDVKLPMLEDTFKMLNLKTVGGAGATVRGSVATPPPSSASAARQAVYRARVKRVYEDGHLGNWERVCPPTAAEAAEYDHSCAFGHPRLASAFVGCCWKRYLADPYPMGSQNFKKLLRAADVFSRRFTSMDADLLFLQIVGEEESGVQRLSFGGVCEALIEVAIRVYPELELAAALTALIERLPEPEPSPHAPPCCVVADTGKASSSSSG